MSTLRYAHLDVFTHGLGGGNHLGVVAGAEHWSDEAMQHFARWNNLVETTYLLPPQDAAASYRVRIFTPSREIPFAGHPSIGTAHIALEWGLARPVDGGLIQQCALGLLPIRLHHRDDQRLLLLKAPPATDVTGHHPLPAELQLALAHVHCGALAPALIDGGRRWWVVECASEAALRHWQPDHAAIAALAEASQSMGICAFARADTADAGYQLVVRAFGAGAGIQEDPASGAANGVLAYYLRQREPDGPLARGYRVSQGREIGHDAALQVVIGDDGIWVGGATRTVVSGQLHWPLTV
ncbi:PhzF family phenazine biosynthesis protein [Frateuria aurantia]